MFCRSLFVILSFFFCPLCSSSCTDSDYPFGIFKLFLSIFNLLRLFSGVLVDIIKNCEYQRNELDDIIIRQGERGDR